MVAQRFLDKYRLTAREPQAVPGVTFKSPLPPNSAVYSSLQEALSGVARLVSNNPAAELDIRTALVTTDTGDSFWALRFEPGEKEQVPTDATKSNIDSIASWSRENGFHWSLGGGSWDHNHPGGPLHSAFSPPEVFFPSGTPGHQLDWVIEKGGADLACAILRNSYDERALKPTPDGVEA